ncbi:Hsp70 family protein [Phytohabitans kaempferiae]|uniref:Hsp70 family protein n=1 Tax=Phytohabitans kaempferiae TaxID=1620943 RepID=A0ABV6M7K5_9ACTN
MAEPILVVDVGTSGTRVALAVGDRSGLLREPGSGSLVWPSSVCLDDAGYLIGTAAERRKRAIPRRYIDGPRRAVDAQASVWLEGREVTGGEALSAYLAVVRGEARQQYGTDIGRVTLTVPAAYLPGDPRRDVLAAACEAAGFSDVELLSSAVAAALDPETGGGLPSGALVLVCVLGATWSVGLVQVRGNHTVQLGQETSGAGHDLDALLINDLRAEGRTWLEPLLAAPGDAGLRAYYEAIDFVRRLKHQLADAEEVADHLTPITPPYRLTREWLAAFADPALQALVASCHSVLAGAGATPADLAAVVLAGGGARLPMVEPALRGALGRAVRRAAEPELAVARGAARWSVGALSRAVPAERPSWRVEPLAWDIPGGQAELVRWLVAEGQPFPAGAPVARVRIPDERVFDLVAPQAGTLLAHRVTAGQPVGPVLVAAAAKTPKALAEHPPPHQHRLEVAGSWLLTPDRQRLVECDGAGRYVRYHGIGDAAVTGEFVPELGAAPVGGQVFVGPDGRLCLVAWDAESWFTVWDVDTGKLTARFRDPGGTEGVRVNEVEWRLATEAEGKAVGRYRRSAITIWDLRTGERVDKVTDEAWVRRHPDYSSTSRTQGFGTTVASPDGQLRATTLDAGDGSWALLVHDIATEQEVFRARGTPARRALAGFSADGRHLLANWESEGRSLVDVWHV